MSGVGGVKSVGYETATDRHRQPQIATDKRCNHRQPLIVRASHRQRQIATANNRQPQIGIASRRQPHIATATRTHSHRQPPQTVTATDSQKHPKAGNAIDINSHRQPQTSPRSGSHVKSQRQAQLQTPTGNLEKQGVFKDSHRQPQPQILINSP